MKKKLMLVVLTSTLLCGCKNNNDIKVHIHTFDNVWLSTYEGHFRKCIYADCEEHTAIKEHTYDKDGICTVCGYSIDDNDNSGCSHNWSTWEVIEDPTCIEEGERERYCSKCGRTQTLPIEPDTVYGHLWRDDLSSDKASTCIENGVGGSQYCFYCYKQKSGETLPLLDHNYETKYHPLAKEPTCEDGGTIFKECKICQRQEFEEVPANGHSYVTSTSTPADGYATTKDSLCSVCKKRAVEWEAKQVTDACKNEKRPTTPLERTYMVDCDYEPNYVENEDGGVSFWRRPIHNAVDFPDPNSVGVSATTYLPIYDDTVVGSFLEYKFTLASDISDADLVADIQVAEYSDTLFTAENPSWTPGLIDSADNHYETRYIITLDDNVLEQDLSKDIVFDNPRERERPRDWFAFPLKDKLNLTSGTHTLRLAMASGYISTFYNFKLEA